MPSYRLKLSAAPLVFLSLAWSYLLFPTQLPFHLPSILQAAFLVVFVFLLTFLYRGLSWEISLGKRDLYVFAAYLLSFSVLNLRMLSESITCDELYHAERAVFYLHGIKLLPEWLRASSCFSRTPMTEINSHVGAVFIGGSLLAYAVYRWIQKRVSSPAARHGLYAGLCLVFAVAAAKCKIPVEPHPPLRLLPLFISQLLFGLQDCSFRFPGLWAVSLVSYLTYRLVAEQKPEQPGFAFLVGFSIYMIPTVYHVSVIVQPSIWGFAAAVGCWYALYWAAKKKDETFVILAAVIVGLGTLCRQNVILLWPVIGLLAFLNRAYIRRWGLVAAPLLFAVPYFLTLTQVGHPVADVKVLQESDMTFHAMTSVQNVLQSFQTGVGPLFILKSTTPLWVLFGLVGMVWVFLRTKTTLKAFYLTLLTGYALFHSIRPELWGVGRYQAEFVAPCIVSTMFLLALELKERGRIYLVACLVFLGFYSYYANQTVSQDVYYTRWTQRKISSEAYFPYKEALDFLQKQETQGRFILIGGIPVYGRMILWLRGFSYEDAENYWQRQAALDELLAHPVSQAQFLTFLREKQIDYFLVQYGEKREWQHRSPNVQALLDGISPLRSPVIGMSPDAYALRQTFIGKVEGAIDLYAKESAHY